MRFSSLAALGAGQLAAAQFANKTSGSSGPQPTGSAVLIGDFSFFGCAASSAGFPTLQLVASDGAMSLDLCAASCSSLYFGVSNTDCYCGDEIDTTTVRVPESTCNTPCPGNKNQFCGGRAPNGLARRQSRPSYLSLYARSSPAYPGGGTTVTSTVINTITSCQPQVTNCPMKTTTPGVCTAPEWHRKKVVCYGNYCAPEHPCPGGQSYRVVCQGDNQCQVEVCTTPKCNSLVVCQGDECRYPQFQGDECNRKVVCYDGRCVAAECYGDECRKNLVCQGEQCRHEPCSGESCFEKVVCNAQGCVPQPPCTTNCPVPPPPGKPVTPTPGQPGQPGCSPGQPGCPPAQPCSPGQPGCPPVQPGQPGCSPGQPGCPPAQPSQPGCSPGRPGCPPVQPSGGKGLPPSPSQTSPVQVAGSGRTGVAFKLLGAAAGLVFML